jgi:hypothetical protein
MSQKPKKSAEELEIEKRDKQIERMRIKWEEWHSKHGTKESESEKEMSQIEYLKYMFDKMEEE